MEGIAEKFDSLARKSEAIGDAMEVLSRKSSVLAQLDELRLKYEECLVQHNEVKQAKDEFKTTQTLFRELNATNQKIQMKMLLLMGHLSEVPVKRTREINNNNNEQPNDETHSVSVATYSRSAKLKSHPPKALKFSDFILSNDALCEENFDKIPNYMRGRTSFQELLDFFNNVIVNLFNEKYRIKYQSRQSLKRDEIDMQVEFREQAQLFDGLKFITANDILRGLNSNLKSLDKKDDRNLQMLRHLQMLKEMRKQNVIAYVWLN